MNLLKKEIKCPLCRQSSNIKKINSISSHNNYFCWNCTAVWPNKERSFIEHLNFTEEKYTYGEQVKWNKSEKRLKLVEWKIKYLKGILKYGVNYTKIIDFGSGPGITLEACERLGIKAIGIEKDIKDYEYCKAKGFEIIQADFNNFEKLSKLFEEKSLLILFNNSLIYNDKIYELIHKLNFSKLHNIDIAIHDQNYFFSSRYPLRVLRSNKTSFIFSSPSLIKLMNDANFNIINSKNYFGTYYLLSRSSKQNVPKLEISFLKKLIYYLYAKNFRIISPTIKFFNIDFLEPLKLNIKNYLKKFKKIYSSKFN